MWHTEACCPCAQLVHGCEEGTGGGKILRTNHIENSFFLIACQYEMNALCQLRHAVHPCGPAQCVCPNHPSARKITSKVHTQRSLLCCGFSCDLHNLLLASKRSCTGHNCTPFLPLHFFSQCSMPSVFQYLEVLTEMIAKDFSETESDGISKNNLQNNLCHILVPIGHFHYSYKLSQIYRDL